MTRALRVAGVAFAAAFTLDVPDAGAIVSHRATACNHIESGGTVTVTKPAGTVAEDILVASAVANDNSGNINPPAGWTVLQADQTDSSSWYKVAGGSEPASYNFTTGAGDTFAVIISAFSGGDTTTPIAGSAKSSGTSASIALPNTTGTRNGSMRWSSVGTSPSNNVPTSWSGGLTEACERAGNDAGLATAYQATGTGATASRTATLTSSEPFWAYTAVVNAGLPEIDSISPTAGPIAGGQTVTITGRNFTGTTGVTFDGLAGTSVTEVSDTSITVVTPAHAIGSVEVRVTATPGTSVDAGAADNYLYTAPPTVTGLSPTAGPTAGGTSVTITGTNFANLSGASAVTFGGTNATSYTVVNSTTITATAPAHAAGNADVRVTTPGGTSANTAADDYTYYAPPTVTGLSPTAGPIAGGTSVTITGTNFGGLSGASAVTFGGTNATSYTVVNSTTITATAPAHAAGNADVRVTTPGGTTANTAADDYTYYSPPTITSISPATGPASGGTVVTITGTNFAGLSGASAVQFGGVDAASYTVVNSTTITATSPVGTGTVSVRVTTPGGTSANTAADDYVYVPLPTVTNVSPAAGPTAGGTSVTITGTDLTGATVVTFGGTNATGYTVVNSTTITATAPAHAAGNADVRVTTIGGTSTNTAADDYTYYAPPTITSLSPMTGPASGGTVVTITGTNFGGLSGASAVQFGATNASSYTVVNSTTITATAPAGTGVVSVSVTTPGGTTANTAADDYTYVPAPTITNVSPNAGPNGGANTVTITGTNLTGTTDLDFGATNATGYTIVNATTITATVPAGTGTVDVRATTVGGTSANTAADDYTYYPTPSVTSISPMSGPAPGGTAVTITGTGFTGTTQVQFGGTNASGFSVVNSTTITATAPPGSGTVDVRVTSPGGTSANTPADDFTYIPPPTVVSISPTSGPETGANTVTITGTTFTGATAVDFGGTAATGFTVVNGTTITATAPAGTGTVSVRVTTPSGTSANTAADDYTYVPAPTVTNVTPGAGSTAGGNTVTITGTNFTGATDVDFGTTDATGYTIVNSTTITATVPAQGAGTVSVRVTTIGGTSANTGADDYTYFATPTVSSISPMSGPAPGGTTVTITGTNFTGATQVQFGGTNATGYTVVNSTTITATSPAGSGTVDVRVTNPGGTSANTAADDFTYIPAPAVVSLSPTSGPETGANTVTITGTDFTTATDVEFGGVPATSFTVVNGTTITATAPAGTGNVSVRVTSPSGISANTAGDDYTYVPAPTVTNLSPSAGPTGGANTVTITGTNFTGASQVQFGGVDATGFTVVNATTITATAPAQSAGTVNVRVTTVGGTSANTGADDYTYTAAPTIGSIGPSSGPIGGGTVVTITGTNFTTATQVQFGGTNATSFTVVNSTTITATAPAGTGTVDVRVTSPGGTSANTASDDFTYIPAPTVASISPTLGPEVGGTVVTITGTDFTTATDVEFSGVAATSFTVVNGTTITATSPAGTGTANVRVTTPSGMSANTAADDFTYVPAPTVSSLSPTSGPTAGGTSVTITGTNFSGTTQVQFGGVDATGYTVVNSTTITATSPAHAGGTFNVRVTTPGGTSADTAADNYTYLDPPTVSSLSPTSGPAAGGTVVTITGSFLTGATQVQFGGVDATSFTVVNPTTITATAPPGTGVASVRVTTADGTSANTAADDFTYINPPAITNLAPSAGPDSGGTSVVITGTDFTGASQVRFGGIDAVGYTVDSATQITATSPTATAGFVSVSVTTPGGTSANTAADDYEYLAACGLGSLTATASDFSFTPLTMNGLDVLQNTTTNVQVSDMTGTGAGWKLEIGTTQFTAGPGQTLPPDAAHITSASSTPLGGNCSTPTSNVSGYPVPLPLSPSKAKVYNAEVGTGRGPVDVELGVSLNVPADTEAGTYVSTWTIDLTAAP